MPNSASWEITGRPFMVRRATCEVVAENPKCSGVWSENWGTLKVNWSPDRVHHTCGRSGLLANEGPNGPMFHCSVVLLPAWAGYGSSDIAQDRSPAGLVS